ncbi:MAG: DUF4156 domain-containing protein [Casimicrobiaceae bacterium]
MRFLLVPILVAAIALGGCASSPTSAVSNVQDGDPAVVNRDCKLLGAVTGRSVFGGGDAARMDGAMADARSKAAAMGATHIVLLKLDNSGMMNTGYATARAYRCDVKSGPATQR